MPAPSEEKPSATGAAPANSSSRSSARAGSAWWSGLWRRGRRWPWPLRAAAWVLGLAGSAVVAAVCLVALALAVAYPNLPAIDSLSDYRPKLPLRVFTADGVEIGQFGEERRIYVPIGQIPQVMKDAVLAAEDTRFYQHGGIDWRGVARAAYVNVITNARSEGASTISMQVARNFYLPTTKTYTRKLYEALLTLKLERMLSKDQILELYMNHIFLGQRAYGFAAAADTYFGKRLDEISVAEAAMLAGIPIAPSAFNPVSNPRRATVRQRHIIERMFETGFITEAQFEQAREEPLRVRPPRESHNYAEHAAETARQLVFAHYGEEAYSRGLNVVLTIDSGLQRVAHQALRRGLIAFEQRQFYRGPEAFVDLPADVEGVDARVAVALAEYPDNEELRAAVVLEASPRRVVAMLQNGETVTITGNGLRPVASGLSARAPAAVQIRRGAVVRMLADERGNWTLTQIPEVEGALVAVDPRTGAVRAMVGGFDFDRNKFNHVTQAWRQPGSSFKPFIYSAALEQGFTPLTQVNDAPMFFTAIETGSQAWEPRNYDGQFDGLLPLHEALARSKNMVSIRLLQANGPEYTQAWAQRFGFEAARHPAYLTMALGAGTVTPLQMATAYSVFANGGHLVQPQLIQRITDSSGRVLLSFEPPPLEATPRSIDERNAFVMTNMLQEVTRAGTAARAQSLLKRNDIFGKTGTTNDAIDVWFAGYQQTLTAVVWVGHSTPRRLGRNETGGGLALPIWIDLMAHALKDVPVSPPEPPEGVVLVDGHWVFDEFVGRQGIVALGTDDKIPEAPNLEERRGILDLFRR
jgi:penicillin-binding protein 1A